MVLNLSYFVFEIWGKDVDKFRPERWLDEEGSVRSVPEFIPFGIGKVLFSYTRCHPRVTSPFGPFGVYIYRCVTDRMSYGAFPLPDSDSYSDSYTDSYEMNKGSTGTNSDGDSYGQLL